MSEIFEFFEENYQARDRYWWKHDHAYSTDPEDHRASLLTRHGLIAAQRMGPGRALDLGAGEGADAIRLALMGWDVVAVEPTTAGVAKIQRFASEVDVRLQTECASLGSFQADGQFDLVICNGVLHYIEDKSSAVAKLHACTRPGGVNVVSLWSSFTSVPDCHRIVPTYPDPEDGVVVSAYEDWDKELLYFERRRHDASHDGMPSHLHSYIKLIATKPD